MRAQRNANVDVGTSQQGQRAGNKQETANSESCSYLFKFLTGYAMISATPPRPPRRFSDASFPFHSFDRIPELEDYASEREGGKGWVEVPAELVFAEGFQGSNMWHRDADTHESRRNAFYHLSVERHLSGCCTQAAVPATVKKR